MANYDMSGNRYTMILVKVGVDGGGNKTYRRLAYDLVRFNVDENPNARPDIVPVGTTDDNKIFERIWKVDEIPFAKKTSFEG